MRIFSKIGIGFFSLCLLFSGYSKASDERGRLNFEVVDSATGESLPAKLIFLRDGIEETELNMARVHGICAEANGFYTAFGRGYVDLPVGTYDVYASRGMEYSVDRKTVTIEAGKSCSVTWKIFREIDPEGFVGCDFHLHTTNSDGKVTPEERVTSLLGEGVEFAASGDHNRITDYAPSVDKMNVGRWIKTVAGEELTTSVGHYCVFPLPENASPFPYRSTDATELFAPVKDFPHRVVLQINHPRTDGTDYFGHFGVHPLTGDTGNPKFSSEFDTLEIMNRADGWGMFTGVLASLSAWEDWFNLLNKNFRPTGVGNSDSHRGIKEPPGWPRNYVRCDARVPREIDARKLIENLLAHRATVARGVFVDLIADEKYRVGDEMAAQGGRVEFTLEVLAPSWAQVDRVTLYGNGREIWSEQVEKPNGPLRYKKKIPLRPDVDTWYLARAEGSKSMWPVTPRTLLGEVTPVAFTNPIWVDVDGNGFESERERAKKMLASAGNDTEKIVDLCRKGDDVLRRQIYALASSDPKIEKELIRLLAFSKQRAIREFIYAKLAEREERAVLEQARQSVADPGERVLLDTYLANFGSGADKIAFMQKVEANQNLNLRWKQVKILSTHRYVRSWHAIGPFPNDERNGLSVLHGPEKGVDLSARETGKLGQTVSWQSIQARPNGFVDFVHHFGNFDHSVAYAFVSIDVPEAMETLLLFGSDDGAAVWHNEKNVYFLNKNRKATPGEELIPIILKKGENRFLVKVENGGGGSGFYFEIYDPEKKLNTK